MGETPIDWVRSKRLAELTGMTVKAIDRKRQRGIWREGAHWVKRDGGIYYSVSACNEWCQKGEPATEAPPKVTRNRLPRIGPGTVYFIQHGSDSIIKIGYTASPSATTRFSTLQVASPVPLTLLLELEADLVYEQGLHSQFRSHHIRGEWFRYEGALREFVEARRK